MHASKRHASGIGSIGSSGSGLTQSVVAALLRWAASEGVHGAYLQVESENAAAIALYRGLGFVRSDAGSRAMRESLGLCMTVTSR